MTLNDAQRHVHPERVKLPTAYDEGHRNEMTTASCVCHHTLMCFDIKIHLCLWVKAHQCVVTICVFDRCDAFGFRKST